MSKMIIEFKKNEQGEWWFRLKGINGKIVLSSETYKRKAHCIRIARKLTVVKEWKIVGIYDNGQ